MDVKELLARCAEDNVKFVSFQFTDIIGTVKSVDAPLKQVEGALKNGIWFDGSSVEGFARVQEGDMHLMPDPDTYAVLPWSPEDMRRARIFCDIYTPAGEPYSKDPRGALKRVVKRFADKGWSFDIGPEPEFFLFKPNGAVQHPVPHDVGGYFDFSPDDAAVRVRTELMAALDSMGLEVEVGHHEVALGQHEIDFRFADALRTADNVLTMKYTVKAIAAQHGLVASFMPKPIFGVNGSGMHCHQSISDASGRNIFYDADKDMGLSDTALGLIAGQLKHARGLAAVIAPSVNSYKRLVPGYEAPVYVGWAQTNRSAMIRIPRINTGAKAVRCELRCPDPSANPYLAFAAMGAAALDGIENGLKPGAPLNGINIFDLSPAEKEQLNIAALPGSLQEALLELEKDTVLREGLGEDIFETFKMAKMSEWEDYRIHVMDWEVSRYLETA